MFSLEVVRGSINQLLRINELSPSSDLIILVHSLELKIKDYYSSIDLSSMIHSLDLKIKYESLVKDKSVRFSPPLKNKSIYCGVNGGRCVDYVFVFIVFIAPMSNDISRVM